VKVLPDCSLSKVAEFPFSISFFFSHSFSVSGQAVSNEIDLASELSDGFSFSVDLIATLVKLFSGSE